MGKTFVIIVKSSKRSVDTQRSAREVYVTNTEHWCYSSTHVGFPCHVDGPPSDAMVFKTQGAAEKIAKRFMKEPHPAGVEPTSFRIVEVEPVYRQVLERYSLVVPSPEEPSKSTQEGKTP